MALAIIRDHRVQVQGFGRGSLSFLAREVGRAIDRADRPLGSRPCLAPGHKSFDGIGGFLEHGDWADTTAGFAQVDLDCPFGFGCDDAAGPLRIYQ